MDQIYIGKEYWSPKSDLPCLHCHGPIQYCPLPIGVSETVSATGIGTCSGFCSWLCSREYADLHFPGDITERLTTRIMLDFKASQGSNDDPDGWRFLQKYDRFSQIPRAPPQHCFVPYGTLTHEAFRENWAGTSSSSRKADTFGSSISPSRVQTYASVAGEESRGSLQSSSVPGAIVDTEPVQQFAFHRSTGYSTKRQYHPSVGLDRTYWPALGIWARGTQPEDAGPAGPLPSQQEGNTGYMPNT